MVSNGYFPLLNINSAAPEGVCVAHGCSWHLFAIAEDKLKLPEDSLDADTHICVKKRVILWPAGSVFVIQSLGTLTPQREENNMADGEPRSSLLWVSPWHWEAISWAYVLKQLWLKQLAWERFRSSVVWSHVVIALLIMTLCLLSTLKLVVCRTGQDHI